MSQLLHVLKDAVFFRAFGIITVGELPDPTSLQQSNHMSNDKELPASRFAWKFSRPGDEFDRSLPEAHSSIPVPQGGHWLRRLAAFAGPGYMVSVGYMDPGNWAT